MDSRALAYCGLDCAACPVAIATAHDDESLRQKTAEEWNRRYGAFLKRELQPQDIVCFGCKSANATVFVGCTLCPIRDCASGKGFETCARCEAYASCDLLNGFFSVHPQTKETLDRLRLNP